ncbi:MAG: hypothetical protein ABL958_04885 [Bdellovibrionia bacterium]
MKSLIAALLFAVTAQAAHAQVGRPNIHPLPPGSRTSLATVQLQIVKADGVFKDIAYGTLELVQSRIEMKKYFVLRLANGTDRELKAIRLDITSERHNRCGQSSYAATERIMAMDRPTTSISVVDNTNSTCGNERGLWIGKAVNSGGIITLVHGNLEFKGYELVRQF